MHNFLPCNNLDATWWSSSGTTGRWSSFPELDAMSTESTGSKSQFGISKLLSSRSDKPRNLYTTYAGSRSPRTSPGTDKPRSSATSSNPQWTTPASFIPVVPTGRSIGQIPIYFTESVIQLPNDRLTREQNLNWTVIPKRKTSKTSGLRILQIRNSRSIRDLKWQ